MWFGLDGVGMRKMNVSDPSYLFLNLKKKEKKEKKEEKDRWE